MRVGNSSLVGELPNRAGTPYLLFLLWAKQANAQATKRNAS
jgi:hypothetical protein